MGVSVLSGAISSAGAATFMMFCRRALAKDVLWMPKLGLFLVKFGCRGLWAWLAWLR